MRFHRERSKDQDFRGARKGVMLHRSFRQAFFGVDFGMNSCLFEKQPFNLV